MFFLALSIACNVLLAIIFKGFSARGIDNHNAITVNYFVCVVVASIFLGESAIPVDLLERPWLPWAMILSTTFIGGFNIMALSFQKAGVALTAIIQKMSLVLPAAFAIALYGESFGWMKGLGIGAALVAVLMVNRPSGDGHPKLKITDPIIALPLLTLLISGVIEIILFYVQVESLVTDDTLQFTATAFGFAGILGVCFSVYRWITKGKGVEGKEAVAGLVLGIPNFLTIYLLGYLLSLGWEASVLFPVNSVSILVLTSIVGFVLYKEKMDRGKIIGVVVGVLSIVFMSLA